MIKTYSVVLAFILALSAYGQDAKRYYELALEKAETGMLEDAIQLFDKSIELKGDVYIAWYNRGMAKQMLGRYEEALIDYDKTLKLYPDYKKAYLNRATTKKHLTDYTGALNDYTYAIQLDKNFNDAYFNRGLLYELLSMKDSACNDFYKAMELRVRAAKAKVEKCNDSSNTNIVIHPILRLTIISDNDKYGFTSENPVKVGTGPNGGPANQIAYLDLLRDQQGKPIKYQRIKSCCDYESENGFFGIAKLDQYQIIYLNDKGEQKTAFIYLSFYDFEEPKILFGFKTLNQK